MTFYDDISFIIRAVNRKAVFKALIIPKTPTQLSKDLQINIGFVSNIIIEIKDRKLIKCLTPNEKRYRLYQRTEYGNKVLKAMNELET